MSKYYRLGGIVLAIVLAGLAAGWYLYKPKPPKTETYASEKIQLDRSRILERKPQEDAKPAHQVPEGAKVERIVRVSVAPEIDKAGAIDTSHNCPALDVDLTLVRLPDESRRVIASSSNGKIVGGVDIPVEAAQVYKELKWAAGITANPLDRTLGGFIDRDLGPFRLGAEVNQIRDGFDVRLKAGVRF